jgi:hypothetical protein
MSACTYYLELSFPRRRETMLNQLVVRDDGFPLARE